MTWVACHALVMDLVIYLSVINRLNDLVLYLFRDVHINVGGYKSLAKFIQAVC